MRLLFLALCLPSVFPQEPNGKTIRVPVDHRTIQAALDSARTGDTVLIEPGTYKESLTLARKSVTLSSRYLASKDFKDVERTILDGGRNENSDGEEILRIDRTAEIRLVGFTIQNSHHAVLVSGKAEVLHNRFHRNGDALSFENGSGIVRSNLFENNSDDGIDLDGSSQAVIEDNIIRNNRDDGIEIRLHDHTAALLTIVIRGNVISGNQEDGIQLIDYPGKSNRAFRIERNVISKTRMAAIGCMSNGNTTESYEGADIPEPVHLINNTFADNQYGVTGGDNVVLLNNVFLRTAKSSLKKVDGDSIFSHNLFWQNGRDLENCDLKTEGKVAADPLLGDDLKPGAGSPCIDAGSPSIDKSGHKIVLAPDTWHGAAPDLGAFEFPKK